MSNKTKQGVPKTPVTRLYAVKLGLADRFTFADILPTVGSRLALKMAGELSKRVAIGEKAYVAYGITKNRDNAGMQTGISWTKEAGEKQYPIKFTKIEIEFLQNSINDLDKKEALTANSIPLQDKILGVRFTEDES